MAAPTAPISRERWAIGMGALAGTFFCAYLLTPFLPAILGALVVSIAMSPADLWLERKTRRPTLSATLCVVLALVVVLIPAVLVATAATGELRDLFRLLAAQTASNPGGGAGESVALRDRVDQLLLPALEWLAARTGVGTEELRGAVIERFSQMAGTLLRSTTAVAGALTEGLVQIVVGVMTLFFLLRDGPAILERLRAASPLSEARTAQLLEHTSAAVVANIYGVLAVAAAQGTLAGAGYWLVGLKSPVLWGVVTALFSMIPLIGTAAVWVPAAAMLAIDGQWSRALLLAGWSAGLVAMADNVVRPWVIGQRTNSSPLLMFFALLGGARLFGLAGLFAGPVALSVTAVLWRFWVAGEKGAEPGGQPVS